MDEKRNKQIDAAYRKARLDAFFNDVGASPIFLLLVAVLFAGLLFFWALVSMPVQRLETARGQLIGQFVTAEEDSPGQWKVSVQLESGQVISMNMPRNQTYQPATPVNVTRYRRSLGPVGFTFYRFEGYAKEAD